MRENAGEQDTIGFNLNLIGCISGASFLNQSHNKVSQDFRQSKQNCSSSEEARSERTFALVKLRAAP